MKRIVILGCENSHADAFLRFIREEEEFSGVEVVGVYSDDRPAAERLREKYDVPVLKHYADGVGKVDGAVITARHGDNHYKYAKPYIARGVPMFIDKPVTLREEEAVAFMRELKSRGIRVSGGSSLKQDDLVRELKRDRLCNEGGKTLSGYVRAPYQRENEYGGFFFYAQHLVEMVCEIFGRFPSGVIAKEKGDGIHVLFRYENYDCVGLFYNKNNLYYASRMSESDGKGGVIPVTQEWYRREFREFCGLLAGEEQKETYEEFISPVFVMNAIARSLARGTEEPVRDIVL